MSLQKILPLTVLSTAVAGLCAFGTPDDCTLSLTVSPDGVPYAPGETMTLTAAGNPGDYVLFMIDMQSGPSTLPYLGGIDIGLPQSSAFKALFSVLDSTGTRSVSCTVDCDDGALLGLDFFLQAVSLNPKTHAVCTSNVANVRWEDDGTCCGPCEGKVSVLTLRYDGDAMAVVRAEGRGLAAGVIFEDLVLPGEEFTLLGNDNKGTLGVEVDIYVDGDHETQIHTSCSQPIGPGLTFGPFTVISGESREGGPLCEISSGEE